MAVALRLRGYDVVTAREAARKGATDVEQLDYAHSEGRIFLTHNIADFAKLHLDYVRKKGGEHSGIILARQLPIGLIVAAAPISLVRRAVSHLPSVFDEGRSPIFHQSLTKDGLPSP